MKETARQSVTFTKRQKERLMAEAERLQISVSQLLGRIVDQWIDQQEGKE